MFRSHRIALNPNNKQLTYFNRASGSARFAYNWALAEWQRQYANGEKPDEIKLRRQLNAIKRQEFPWMTEVSKVVVQQSIKNLGVAYKNFFNDLAKFKHGEIKKNCIRKPKFKKRGLHDSFRADNGPRKVGVDAIQIQGSRIKLPKIGWIRMFECLRFNGQVKSATVSKSGGRWFVSISVEIKDLPPKSENQATGGVDLGCDRLAAKSTGEIVVGPKPHKALLSRLRMLSKSLSRKQKGSSHWREAKRRLGLLHYRIGNIRRDSLHKLTTELVYEFGWIGIEDLNVRGMSANRNLARSILDMGFYEFRRQLEYKAPSAGSHVVIANRWFASSKTCSLCGWKNADLKLRHRTWVCSSCGVKHDRDINAASNLEKVARKAYDEYNLNNPLLQALQEGKKSVERLGSGYGCKAVTKPTSMKRGLNIKAT